MMFEEIKVKPIKRNKLREFFINFALFYSLIAGIIFVSYAIYRHLFSNFYYIMVLVIFIVYLLLWIIDKLVSLYGRSTKN